MMDSGVVAGNSSLGATGCTQPSLSTFMFAKARNITQPIAVIGFAADRWSESRIDISQPYKEAWSREPSGHSRPWCCLNLPSLPCEVIRQPAIHMYAEKFIVNVERDGCTQPVRHKRRRD